MFNVGSFLTQGFDESLVTGTGGGHAGGRNNDGSSNRASRNSGAGAGHPFKLIPDLEDDTEDPSPAEQQELIRQAVREKMAADARQYNYGEAGLKPRKKPGELLLETLKVDPP